MTTDYDDLGKVRELAPRAHEISEMIELWLEAQPKEVRARDREATARFLARFRARRDSDAAETPKGESGR